MSFTGAVILYLSIGAPFAAHLVASRPRRPIFGRLLQGVGAMLAWPLLAFRFALLKPFGLIGRPNREAGRAAGGEDIFEALKSVTEGNVSAEVSQAIYFAVEKYSVLTSEASEAAGDLSEPPLSPVFGFGGHSKPEIGSICLARRNSRVIENHRLSALGSLEKILKGPMPEGVRLDILSVLRSMIEKFNDDAGQKVLDGFELESNLFAVTDARVGAVLRTESA